MIGVKVTLPIACFRKGMAREYLETYDAPPPATCYGFLLSLVGETDRNACVGARVSATVVERTPGVSVVLRTVWRVKKTPLGSPGNTRPDFQQLLTNVKLIVWLDSSEESPGDGKPTLEERVRIALDPARRSQIERFGGLAFGESTFLVDEVSLYDAEKDAAAFGQNSSPRIFLLDENGATTLPVWVDHVGSEKTRYATGNFEDGGLTPPEPNRLPTIQPCSTLSQPLLFNG